MPISTKKVSFEDIQSYDKTWYGKELLCCALNVTKRYHKPYMFIGTIETDVNGDYYIMDPLNGVDFELNQILEMYEVGYSPQPQHIVVS